MSLIFLETIDKSVDPEYIIGFELFYNLPKKILFYQIDGHIQVILHSKVGESFDVIIDNIETEDALIEDLKKIREELKNAFCEEITKEST